jgi:hypothetical protein
MNIEKLIKSKIKKKKVKSNICAILHICLVVVYLYILWGTNIIRDSWLDWRFNETFSFINVYAPLALFILIMGIICLIFYQGFMGYSSLIGIAIILAQSITICVWIGQNDDSLGWLAILLLALLINVVSAIPGTILLIVISNGEELSDYEKRVINEITNRNPETQYEYSIWLIKNNKMDEAINYLEKAAEAENTDAKTKLMDIYYQQGLCKWENSKSSAIKDFEKAYALGNSDAKEKLDEIALVAEEYYTKGLQIKKEQGDNSAKEWFAKAVGLGHSKARTELNRIQEKERAKRKAKEKKQEMISTSTSDCPYYTMSGAKCSKIGGKAPFHLSKHCINYEGYKYTDCPYYKF